MPARTTAQTDVHQLLVELAPPPAGEDRAAWQRAALRDLEGLQDVLGRGLVSWATPEVQPRIARQLAARCAALGGAEPPALDRFLRVRLAPPSTAADLRTAWGDDGSHTITGSGDPGPQGRLEGAIKELARIPGEVLWQPNLGEPPGGMAVFDSPVWPASAGQGVRLAFLAPGYQRDHPDYRHLEVRDLRPPVRHDRGLGTWTLGVLAAQPIHAGLVGICPKVQPVFVRPWTERPGLGDLHSTADAAALACTVLQAGDVLLLAHAAAAGPVERDLATFAAIQLATALGIHVIQAAGDRALDLDGPEHQGLYDRSLRDSGAVMVTGYLRRPLPPPSAIRIWGAHGTRIDAHAPAPIYTTKPSGTHRHLVQWFQGSTAAATQVAGVVALASGAVQQQGGAPVDPERMRALLTATGTPAMMESDRAIAGTQPNLGALLKALGVPG